MKIIIKKIAYMEREILCSDHMNTPNLTQLNERYFNSIKTDQEALNFEKEHKNKFEKVKKELNSYFLILYACNNYKLIDNLIMKGVKLYKQHYITLLSKLFYWQLVELDIFNKIENDKLEINSYDLEKIYIKKDFKVIERVLNLCIRISYDLNKFISMSININYNNFNNINSITCRYIKNIIRLLYNKNKAIPINNEIVNNSIKKNCSLMIYIFVSEANMILNKEQILKLINFHSGKTKEREENEDEENYFIERILRLHIIRKVKYDFNNDLIEIINNCKSSSLKELLFNL